jgi:hypothetical protein
MRNLIFTLTLTFFIPTAVQAQNPSWQSDYAKAQQIAGTQQKPIAVVFGQGVNGWQQLGGGSLTEPASRLLAERYIPCYVDTGNPGGRALARQFDMDGSTGIVISDRTGKLQAFWHQGPLSADLMVTYLSRYSDPNRTVVTTDRNPAEPRFSSYPPATYAPGYYPSAGFAPAMGFGGGAACRS